MNEKKVDYELKDSLPLVSIGMPIFNGLTKKHYFNTDIRKSLNSILNQSYKNLEIIISDNCSTDDTANIIYEISQNDKRVKFFKQTKPLGAGENFSFVLAKAKGKYFKWNCHDDFISNNFIEKNLNFLEKNKSFIFSSSPSCYDFDYFRKKNVLSFDLEKPTYKRIKEFHKQRSVCLSMVYGLIRRENLINTTDFTKDYLGIDWIVILELLFQGNFKSIDEGLIVIGSTGRSTEKNHLKRKEYSNKFIYNILPYYEFNKVCISYTLKSNELNFFEKISLIFTTLKMNLAYMYFYKLEKIKYK